jgi:hypothetical protein
LGKLQQYQFLQMWRTVDAAIGVAVLTFGLSGHHVTAQSNESHSELNVRISEAAGELRKHSRKERVMPSVAELARSSSLIFSGTVVERGTSSVPTLPPNDNLVVARVDRALRVDPVLGDLRGKLITVVATVPENLSVGQQAVFFTNSWIHGRGIAVREVAHLDPSQADAAAQAVAKLPEEHLVERLRSAELVVQAEVTNIGPPDKVSRDRKAAWWARAELKIQKVLRGAPGDTAVVYFATADWPPWTYALRLKTGQRGVFILHARSETATRSEAALKAGTLVAVDPADFQPESQLEPMQNLLAGIP